MFCRAFFFCIGFKSGLYVQLSVLCLTLRSVAVIPGMKTDYGEWVKIVRKVLRMVKIFYPHRGIALKYERLWAQWLDVLRLAPMDLIMDRLLGLNAG